MESKDSRGRGEGGEGSPRGGGGSRPLPSPPGYVADEPGAIAWNDSITGSLASR